MSSPDRVVLPALGLTKLEVVEYFVAVGDGILGALRDRPTTLERWPKGWFDGARLSTRADSSGDGFYQKRVPRGAPDWVTTARITFPSGRFADEMCPTELAVVAWAANLGTLTFHPWPVTAADTEAPDELRIDLDPQPGTDFTDAARVAPHARELLHELGLRGLAQDLRRARAARVRADRAPLDLHPGPARDDRLRPRARAAAARTR